MENVNRINAEEIQIPKGTKEYKVVSLFSGCGGMDLGFMGNFHFLNKEYAKNPFKIIFANDIFKQAAQMYEDNFEQPVERRDVKELDVDKDFQMGRASCRERV